ncbi:MAG: efflux RND transporter periplasmic adaptor subunit [Bacteroidia bacterium]
MKNKKRVYWISGIIILTLIVAASIFKGGKSEELVTIEKIQNKTIVETVTVTGKILPKSEVKISPDVSGEIIDMFVNEGDSVVEGQLLVTINPEIYLTTVNQLRANLNNAKANLSSAEAQELRSKVALDIADDNFERQKKLHQENITSDLEWENARVQYEQIKTEATVASKNKTAALYNVKSLAARLDEGMKTLGRTKILAPQSGIVTQLSSEKGERVVGTAQMAGTEIMRISDLSRMEVEVKINENDIVRLELNDEADIRVDAYPKKTFTGRVTEIANSAKFNANMDINEQVTNYTVKIQIDPSSYADLISASRPQPLLPGMTASAEIKTEKRENALALPIAALTTRDPKKDKSKDSNLGEFETWVFIYENGKAVAKKVKTGIQDLDYFEVISGLSKGENVITSPSMSIAKTMMDGDKVSRKPTK